MSINRALPSFFFRNIIGIVIVIVGKNHKSLWTVKSDGVGFVGIVGRMAVPVVVAVDVNFEDAEHRRVLQIREGFGAGRQRVDARG